MTTGLKMLLPDMPVCNKEKNMGGVHENMYMETAVQ